MYAAAQGLGETARKRCVQGVDILQTLWAGHQHMAGSCGATLALAHRDRASREARARSVIMKVAVRSLKRHADGNRLVFQLRRGADDVR